MYIARPMFDADFVINLPKFKTHSAGFLPAPSRTSTAVFPACARLNTIAWPRIPGLRRRPGRHSPGRQCGLAYYGRSDRHAGGRPPRRDRLPCRQAADERRSLALDTVAVAMLGLEIEDIPILHSARASGLGEASPAEYRSRRGLHRASPGSRGLNCPSACATSSPGPTGLSSRSSIFSRPGPGLT